jgi:hypothetical protein
MIAFLTKSKLILSATRRNGLVLDAQFSKLCCIIAAFCKQPLDLRSILLRSAAADAARWAVPRPRLHA